MKIIIKRALVDTFPVLTGYLVLGFGFGILLKVNGFGLVHAFVMSLLIYAGSMQYVAIGLFTSGASLLTVAITTLMVNARHLFYGISMIDRYRDMGIRKPYLMFSLTDETYSLVCGDHSDIPEDKRKNYYFLVSVFDQMYWIMGSVLGVVVGSVVQFNSEGIDFSLTALFVTVFVEQWMTSKRHAPAVIGVVVSVICLVLFGSENFLIPTMLVITLLLCLYKEETEDE